ncbi:MAG: sensor histidine kinase [Burkholderiales bacterium]
MFGLVALGLVGSILVIFSTLRDERAERAQLARMNEVMIGLRDVNRAMINAETGQRGYLITIDNRYLGPYRLARSSYPTALRRVEALASSTADARQLELLAQVRQLSQARFAELDETVALISQGNIDDARRRILTDEGKDVMDRFRVTIYEMERFELGEMDRLRAQTAASEARIIPMLIALLALIIISLALGLWQVFRAADAELRAGQANALGEARDRADLLAGELNHRVKNLFAVVLAIVRMSGRDAPEAKPVVERIANRIDALLKAHEVTQGASLHRVAQLRDLAETAVAPYRSDEHRCTISGPPVELPEAQVVPIGLVLHELVTNAVKYGAWSDPGGSIAVHWAVADGSLTLDWTEHCAKPCPAPDDKQGFGSLLVQSAARQLQGSFEREHSSDGMSLRLEFPLVVPFNAPETRDH